MFVDAAAPTAILSGEAGARRCAEATASAAARTTFAIAVWQAALALASERKRAIAGTAAAEQVGRSLEARGIDLVDLPPPIEAVAIAADAAERFGASPDRLSLADGFRHTRAKHRGTPILSTADEFRFTDLAAVP